MKNSHLDEREEIPVRKPHIDFQGDSRFWFANNSILTCLMNALSATLPAAESLFIRIIRERAAGIADEGLRRDVQGFIGQEAQHSKQHIQMNRWLEQLGFPMEAMSKRFDRKLHKLESKLTPDQLLAATAALEHYTAVIAKLFLRRQDLLDTCPTGARRLMQWHAVEEIEHKSVCFDVFQHAVGHTGMRRRAMVMGTIAFTATMLGSLARQLIAVRHVPRPRELWQAAKLLLAPRGVVFGILGAAAVFMRKSFHPANTDDSALVAKGRRQLAADVSGGARSSA